MICEVKDIISNQVFTDLSMDDVCEMLNVAKQTVYRAISEETIVHRRYRIMGVGNGNLKNKSKMPDYVLIEWDEVASKFRKLKRCAE